MANWAKRRLGKGGLFADQAGKKQRRCERRGREAATSRRWEPSQCP